MLTSFGGGILAVCKARILRRGFLYLHIADMADNLKVTLSVPAFSVISGGSHTGNKLATGVSDPLLWWNKLQGSHVHWS